MADDHVTYAAASLPALVDDVFMILDDLYIACAPSPNGTVLSTATCAGNARPAGHRGASRYGCLSAVRITGAVGAPTLSHLRAWPQRAASLETARVRLRTSRIERRPYASQRRAGAW